MLLLGDTGVRVDLIWQILYIVLAIMIAFIIPFAFFFYENDVDEDAETEGFFDTQAGGALKYTFIVAAVFCVLLGILYAFLNHANIPVTRYAQVLEYVYDINAVPLNPNTVDSCSLVEADAKGVSHAQRDDSAQRTDRAVWKKDKLSIFF